jgi:hypothetical protein
MLIIRRVIYIVDDIAAPAPVRRSWHDRFGAAVACFTGAAAVLAVSSATPSATVLALTFIAAGGLTYRLLKSWIGRAIFAAALVAGLIAGFAALDPSSHLQHAATHQINL